MANRGWWTMAAFAAAGFALFAVATAEGADGPKVGITDTKQLATPLPQPYDETADADAAVDAAFARAKASHKRVLIEMGANWCGDCRILSAVLERPEVQPFVQAHFEMAQVDVGRFNKNQQIPARFHAKVNGIPWIVIAEPDGHVLVSSYDITDEHHQTPQSMVDWLASWAD